MICILPNTLVENVKNLIEYNVNKPVSNSYCNHLLVAFMKALVIANLDL